MITPVVRELKRGSPHGMRLTAATVPQILTATRRPATGVARQPAGTPTTR